MQFHPDRNPGDHSCEHKFKEINEAYETLKDPQKRAAYDRFGHAAFEQGGMNGGAQGFGAGGFADIFEDIFGDMMGGRQRRSSGGRERGADLRYNMEITLEEAFAGKTAQIRVPASISCTECSGTGAKPGTQPVTCSMCDGHGKVRAAQGFFSIERTCPQCQGRGQTIKDPCPKCAGQGRVTEERSLSVNIPAGIEDGTRIRLANEGEAGLRGGPSGDLYIFLAVKPHEFFQRDGADLYCKVPISMTTAALGGSFEVATLDGTPDQGEGAGRHAERPPVPPQGQGHAGAAPAAISATSTSRPRSRRRRTCRKPPARAAGRVRAAVVEGQFAAVERLFRPHEGLFRIVRRALIASVSQRALGDMRSLPERHQHLMPASRLALDLLAAK